MTLLLLLAHGFAAPPLEVTPSDVVRADVRGTTQSVEAVVQQLERLEPARKAEAAASLRFLSVNDPYTRAAMQLPFALQQVAAGIDADRLDGFVQRDWQMLQRGLNAHIAALEALDVDLARPAPGDVLYGAKGMSDLQALRSSKDPLVPTLQWIEQLPALAEKAEPIGELLDVHAARVEEATGVTRPCPRGPWSVLPGQPWTLGMELGGWHDALRRLQPFVHDPEVAARVEAMIEVIDAWGAMTTG